MRIHEKSLAWTAGMAALLALALATACGGSGGSSDQPPSFDATPVQTVHSTSGALQIAVHAEAGHAPGRGVNAFQFVVTDANGAPMTGLQLGVVPWMPDMAHGTSVAPTVTAAGGGAYTVTNVYFPMPGRWDLISSFTGPVTDAAKPSFQIP
jgi:YtkA-like